MESEATWAVFSLYEKRRLNPEDKRVTKTPRWKGCPDKVVRRRLLRRREFEVPKRITSYAVWNTYNVEFPETRCSLHVNHRSGVHSLLRNHERFTMDKSILKGTRNEPTTSVVHGQRSSLEANKDSNHSSPNQTHQTQIPLCQRTSEPGCNNDTGDQRQGKSSRSLDEILPISSIGAWKVRNSIG